MQIAREMRKVFVTLYQRMIRTLWFLFCQPYLRVNGIRINRLTIMLILEKDAVGAAFYPLGPGKKLQRPSVFVRLQKY